MYFYCLKIHVFLDSMSRVNSVTNILKKIFTREDSRDTRIDKDSPIELTAPGGQTQQTLYNRTISGGSGSTQSIHPKTQPNSMRITDQIIEEVKYPFFNS